MKAILLSHALPENYPVLYMGTGNFLEKLCENIGTCFVRPRSQGKPWENPGNEA